MALWPFDTEGFPPRWECGSGWTDEPWLGWLHITADTLTAAAYVAIPCLLVMALRKRGKEFPTPTLVLLFAAFILACGLVHALEVTTFYTPVYRLSGIAKAVMAIVSVATVGALTGALPRLLAYRSPTELDLEVQARTHELTRTADRLDDALKQLNEERSRVQVAMRAGAMGSWDWDLEKGEVTFDETQREITGLGLAGEPISPNQFFECVHPEDRDELNRQLDESISAGTPYNHSFRFLTPQGESKWLSGRGLLLEQPGRPRRFVGVNFDVTPQKELEIELQRARVAAESANVAKSQFLANTSHEIRTPLTAILGCAEALVRDPRGSDSIETASVIRDQGESLLRVLNDVLDLSKMEAGKLEITPGPCSPAGIISDVESLILPLANRKGLTLTTRIEATVPAEVISDGIRIRQVLLNLVTNAVKFSQQGRVQIELTTQPTTNPQRLEMIFRVSDEGPGIPPEELKEIFLPFHQVDRQETRRVSGSGLGLAISHRLAELIGGVLEVQSELGRGSVFTLRVPAVVTKASDNAIDPASGVTAFPADIGGRVLIADDTPSVRYLLKQMFRTFPGELAFEEDGRAAVASVMAAASKGAPFDLVLLDMHMPELSGYDAARTIRRAGITTPIIALTASAMAGDREECLAAGCDAYVSKPIDWTNLIQEVVRQLRRGQRPPGS